MGIFSKIKNSVKSKANAAIDKATDPEKELDLAIEELDENYKLAIKELIAYKATAKTMQRDIDSREEKANSWEEKAMKAVKAGNDDLAREALTEKKRCEADVARIKKDRDEAASYAIRLNKSRKTFESKLKMLKLKKGTMAAQLAVNKDGGNPMSTENELWDRFERMEDAIDDEVIQAEVDTAMESGGISEAEFEAALRRSSGTGGGELGSGESDSGDALAALKAKMNTKKLGE